MDTITIAFGPGNSITKALDEYPTVDDILESDALAAALGFGNNVEARINGIPVKGDIPAGSRVELVTHANTKGN